MSIDGVIFDFNGTMIYDGKLQEDSWRTFLYEKIGREVTDSEFNEYVHGRNADVSLPYFLERKLNPDEIEQLSEEKEVIYRELFLKDKTSFKLISGLPHFLDVLKQEKIPFTIATASGLKNVQFFFQQLNLDRWFDFEKVVYDDGTFPGKPDPYIYEKAAQKIGILPRNCVVFEDAKAGVIAAKCAGIGKIMGVAKVPSKSKLHEIKDIDHIISDFYDVYDQIKG